MLANLDREVDELIGDVGYGLGVSDATRADIDALLDGIRKRVIGALTQRDERLRVVRGEIRHLHESVLVLDALRQQMTCLLDALKEPK